MNNLSIIFLGQISFQVNRFFPIQFLVNSNQVTGILKSLLNGNEVLLNGGASDILSQQILHLFTELKRVQSEQSAVSAQVNIPSVSVHEISSFFWSNLCARIINIFFESYFSQRLPDPVEKEFTLRVSGAVTDAVEVGGPQFLR